MASRRAKLIFVNAPTRDSEMSRKFYGSLFGAEFAHGFNPNVAGWWTPLEAGIDFNITMRYDDRERLTPYFAVDDLEASIKQLEEVGGRCVVAPREVVLGPDEARKFYEEKLRADNVEFDGEVKTVARMAIVLDPDLNHLGLMQVQPFARMHYGLDEEGVSNDRKGFARIEKQFARTRRLADELEQTGALPSI